MPCQLVAGGVEQHVVDLERRVLRGNPPRGVQEEPVGRWHDRRLVHHRDAAPAVRLRPGERGARHPLRARVGDELEREPRVRRERGTAQRPDGLGDARRPLAAALEPDAGVQILLVHPHDDHIDPFTRPGRSGEGARRAHGREQPEAPAQLQVGRAGLGAVTPRGHRTLQRHPGGPDRLLGRVRNGVAEPLPRGLSRPLLIPIDPGPRGVEDQARGRHHLGAHAVARQQCHPMRHRAA